MKRILAIMAIVAAILVAPAVGLAQRIGPRHAATDLGVLVNNQTLASARSFTVTGALAVRGMGLLVLHVKTTNNGGLTQISMACTSDLAANTGPYTLESCSVSAGVCTSSASSFVKAITASPMAWEWRVDTLGIPETLACTFTPTGGDAGDFITVTGHMVTQ